MHRIIFIALLSLGSIGVAHASCEVDIEVGDSLEFSVSEINVEKSCDMVTVNLAHTGAMPAAAMGHNWVLSSAADLQPVAVDGQSQGVENNYLKPEDDRVIAHTEVVGGGEETTISFSIDSLEAGGEYMFYCTAPGHWAVMQGKFNVS